MRFSWQYPLYLIPLESGYVSVVDSGSDGAPIHLLALFCEEELAVAFMHHLQIPGAPRPIRSAREFGWFLQSLRSPVTHVAFDPNPLGERLKSRWRVSVKQLLEEHLVSDRSPWNYPVFVIGQQTGYASIEGTASSGEAWTAVSLFTAADKANAYLRASGQAGTVETLSDMDQARRFLQVISREATAVAIDPHIEEGRHSARFCVPIRVLLDKYLVTKGEKG